MYPNIAADKDVCAFSGLSCSVLQKSSQIDLYFDWCTHPLQDAVVFEQIRCKFLPVQGQPSHDKNKFSLLRSITLILQASPTSTHCLPPIKVTPKRDAHSQVSNADFLFSLRQPELPIFEYSY